MRLTGNLWKKLASSWGSGSAPSRRPRRPRRKELSWDCLEERKVLSHVGLHHHAHHASAITGSVSSSGSTTSATDSTASTAAATTATSTAGTTASSTATSSTARYRSVHRPPDAPERRPGDRARFGYDGRSAYRDRDQLRDAEDRRPHSHQRLGTQVLREQPGDELRLRDDDYRQRRRSTNSSCSTRAHRTLRRSRRPTSPRRTTPWRRP